MNLGASPPLQPTAKTIGISHHSISNNGFNRPNSQTFPRLAVWTVGALVAEIRSKTRV